jgi:activator of HSP90 ATPase
MAKWGEGDERWIVQDREDGANVNAWHWEEKQRIHWVKERIPQILVGLAAEGAKEVATVKVKEVTSVEGDVRFPDVPRWLS